MPNRPTGPQDPTPGPEIQLTPDQFEVLALFVPKGNTSTVRLQDKGANYVQAQLLDPAGNVTKSRLLYRLRMKQDSPAARRRRTEEQTAGSEEERTTRSEQEQPPD